MPAAAVVENMSWNAAEIFDPAEALERACDDLELLTELSDLFGEHRDHLLQELTSAIAEGDTSRVAEAGHAIKGSIGTFTTKLPYELARRLEFSGKDQDLSVAARTLDQLKSSLAALEREVNRFLAQA